MDLVIIGHSAAGIAAAEAIREMDQTSRVTIVSEELHEPYSRPLISDLLAGHIEPGRMRLRSRGHLESLSVRLLLGRRVERIVPAEGALYLQDGSTLGYDRLLIATGASPIRPPIAGADKQGVYCFTKLDDAIRLREALPGATGAVVIGGGLIGMKAAEGLLGQLPSVAVVELADHILPTALDSRGARLLERHLRARGIEVICGDPVERITGNGHATGVVTRSGRMLDGSLVLLCVGVKADLALVEDTGIETDRGIVVDDSMRTTVPSVFAAGDVAQARDMLTGTMRPIPIWPLAVRMGRIAGINMAGGQAVYGSGFSMNSIEVCGLPTVSVGLLEAVAGCTEVSRTDEARCSYRKLVLRDGAIVGMVSVGDIDRVGIITGLIRERTNVSGFVHALLAPRISIASLPAWWREEKLGRAPVERGA